MITLYMEGNYWNKVGSEIQDHVVLGIWLYKADILSRDISGLYLFFLLINNQTSHACDGTFTFSSVIFNSFLYASSGIYL